MANLLIIEDDRKICRFLADFADGWGHTSTSANTIKDGLDLAATGDYDLVLLDLELPDGNGLQALPLLLRSPSKSEVIIITGTGGIAGAKMAFKYGAWDYVQKPFTMEEVFLPVTRALQYRKERNASKMPVSLNRQGIMGSSPAILNCLEAVARASVTDASVLITGETGTGKELFARAIHENSRRAGGPVVPVDCGAIPESLAEGIFFGNEKGAFTGADIKREGIIRQADGGTLFLDEIGDLPLGIQKSLLRVLQEKRIRPVGGKQEVAVDFRLVAATHRDLAKMVSDRLFREDLLFRIRAIEVRLPPLRERGNDLQEITISETARISQRFGAGTKGISPEFIELLNAHVWPGNVRELINVLEHAMAFAGDDPTLYPKHLPPEYRALLLANAAEGPAGSPELPTRPAEIDRGFPSLSEFRAKTEKEYLKMLIDRSRGDRDKACRLSGMSQSQLYNLLKKHDISFRSASDYKF